MEADAAVLVVEDELNLREGLRLTLEAEGYRALAAADGFEALEALQSQSINLILADIAMPRMNGYQLYERVRENVEWVGIPFIFLTARAMDSDIRYGKELGADDYLTKPVAPEDLLAAVRGKLKRAQQLAEQAASLVASSPLGPRAILLGKLQIDPGQHRVWMEGELVSLSAREFTLLECLAHHAGQVCSLQDLVQVTHDLETDCVEAGALLRPLIRSLRRKLGYGVGEMGCVENVRGLGYRLVVPSG